jgi:uncharacterized membrane protein
MTELVALSHELPGVAAATILFVDPYLTDWLDLVLRWLHVIAAVVWIGTSFYFVALDNHLLPPKDERDAEEGVAGEAWEIHGGGFYLVQKYRVAPPRLPEPLHWFKWEAYTTWLSGFALFVVLYYLDADVRLVDPAVADLAEGVAIALSAGFLLAAWLVYDGLCRTVRNDLVLAAALLVLVGAAAYGSGELFSARAAYLEVGAMLGTIMAANVLLSIIPAHRELIRAKEAGREPDPRPGIEAKRRSVHNNYLTLPVLFSMLSTHFPFTYGHAHAWLVLVALMVIGAWVRHFFNLRHAGRTVWAIPATAAVATIALALAIRPDETPAARGGGGPVDFARVQQIVAERCAPCHSASPTDERFGTAPAGVNFDTPEQIAAQADAIDEQAVRTKAMPLGNATGMTDEERSVLGAWILAGAPTR